MANSNTKTGPGEKGSKFWMQEIANSKVLSKIIENKLKVESLKWWSPRKDESYKEYMLNEKDISKKLFNLTQDELSIIFDFWPSGQPRWDAIATSNKGETLYLFEAKSHIDELHKPMSIKNTPKGIDSKNLRISSLEKTYKILSKKDTEMPNCWTKKYYQLANRLTFICEMNELSKNNKLGKVKKVVLVLLNIVNDDFGKTDKDAWIDKYNKVYLEMIGNNKLPKEFQPLVKEIYFDVKENIT